jgi:hypothetical protein
MPTTYAQQLESVQTAIAQIELGAQSYTLEGVRTVTRADLGMLYKREERLRVMAAREARGGGIRVRYGVPF